MKRLYWLFGILVFEVAQRFSPFSQITLGEASFFRTIEAHTTPIIKITAGNPVGEILEN
jgi:hypothetical protein